MTKIKSSDNKILGQDTGTIVPDNNGASENTAKVNFNHISHKSTLKTMGQGKSKKKKSNNLAFAVAFVLLSGTALYLYKEKNKKSLPEKKIILTEVYKTPEKFLGELNKKENSHVLIGNILPKQLSNKDYYAFFGKFPENKEEEEKMKLKIVSSGSNLSETNNQIMQGKIGKYYKISLLKIPAQQLQNKLMN